jgi:hypothetical protein
MSLKHIQRRSEPITFGSNLSVLINDTFINGDLDIQGAINGTSSQGQNTNNTWTGTNEYSVYRPTSSLPSVGLQDGVSEAFLETTITDEGIINAGANWSGVNSFALPITMMDGTNANPVYIPPVNATDAVCGQYIADSWSAKGSAFTTTNNTWTASNTFNVLPSVLDPLVSTSIASKNYTDTTISSITQGKATTITSTLLLQNQDWGATNIAVSAQIIGGGGGSTSSVGACTCSSGGVSGGSGSQASIVILTDYILGGVGGQGLFDLVVGGGGSAGVGCGTGAGSGGGGATNLFVTPKAGSGYNPLQVNILRANGGGGAPNLFCGDAGTTAGGTYSNINPLVVSPFASSNGKNGVQCGGSIPQYYGVNTLGWGGRGASCANGVAGGAGGYGITFFTG